MGEEKKMEMTTGRRWLDRLNKINAYVFMPLMGLSLLMFGTVLIHFIGGELETAQNVLAAVILLIAVINILFSRKAGVVSFAKENILVILYLATRITGFIIGGFSYVTLRSIFFETFFLIGLSKYTSCSRKQLNGYLNMFLVFFLLMSALCMKFYIEYGQFNFGSTTAIPMPDEEYTLCAESVLFSNPNTAGIMGAFAIVLMLSRAAETQSKLKKIVYAVLSVFELFFVYIQDCRSAVVGLIFIAVTALIKIILRVKSGGQFAVLSLIIAIGCMCGLYYYIGVQLDNNPKYLNRNEQIVNEVSTGRYAIWKASLVEQQDHLMFGAGALSTEMHNRSDMVNNPANGYSDTMRHGINLGTHNGYIGMISVTGLQCFILFMLIMFKKIKDSRMLKKGSWYLIVMLLLEVNLFETLFILNRFFLCFYTFIIMEAEPGESDGKKLKELKELKKLKKLKKLKNREAA